MDESTLNLYRLRLAPMGYGIERTSTGVRVFNLDRPQELRIPTAQLGEVMPQLLKDLEDLEALKLTRKPDFAEE